MRHDEKKIKEIVFKEAVFADCKGSSILVEELMKQYAEHMVQQERGRICNYINQFPLSTGMVDIKDNKRGINIFRDFVTRNITKNEHNCEVIINLINKQND